MTADPLFVLLVLSLAASCLCLLISMAMVGRKLADLDYQRARGIGGTARIQGYINLRTHGMRVLVGVTFGVFAVLLIADAPMIWRQWVNRTLFVVVPAGYALVSVLDWMAEREQQRIEIAAELAARDANRARLSHEESQRMATLQANHDAYREMAAEAVANLEVAAAHAREIRGEPPMVAVAPVVPEHSSPVTPDQQATASRATLRAQLVASTRDLNLPPREAPPVEHRDAVDVESIQSGAADDIVSAVRRADREGSP